VAAFITSSGSRGETRIRHRPDLYTGHVVQAFCAFRTPPLAHHAHPQHARRRERHPSRPPTPRARSRKPSASTASKEPWQRERLAARRIR
jgi:hypothetical protein